MDLSRANPAWESDLSVMNWSPLSQSVSGLKQSLILVSLLAGSMLEGYNPPPPCSPVRYLQLKLTSDEFSPLEDLFVNNCDTRLPNNLSAPHPTLLRPGSNIKWITIHDDITRVTES